MTQDVHCVAVFSLDVEHKEEDRRDAVKTEVRFPAQSVLFFFLLAGVTLEVSFTLPGLWLSFFFKGLSRLQCHKPLCVSQCSYNRSKVAFGGLFTRKRTVLLQRPWI